MAVRLGSTGDERSTTGTVRTLLPGQSRALARLPYINILFVCTGNVFRSPIAQAFLTKIARDRSLGLTVQSAGTLPGERSILPEALKVISARGVDISAHRSRQLGIADVGRAHLILGMAREHVREVALVDPEAWPRTFTLKELVRRGELLGARSPSQTLSQWLALIGQTRPREDLVGSSSADDVEDPLDRSLPQFQRTADELWDLVNRVVRLIEPDE